jgi:hypothetical protein
VEPVRWKPRWIASVLAAIVLVACAPMSVGPPAVTDVRKASHERPVPNGLRVVEIEQHGTALSVSATELCDVQQVDDIQRTTVRGYKNDAPQNDVWAGVLGTAAVGAGVVSIVSPATMRGGNEELSDEEVRNLGYGLVGVGALLLAVPVIDHFRAQRIAERKVEYIERPGPFLRRNARCSPTPSGTKVFARAADGQDMHLGELDVAGALRADLDEALPSSWAFPRDARVRLYVASQAVGEFSLTELYDAREVVAWKQALSSACATSLEPDACGADESYLRRFPEGGHAAEAKERIAAAATRRVEAAEEASFSNLDLDACRRPRSRDSSSVRAACAPLAAHVAAFPDGRHGEAVREALRSGEAFAARLPAPRRSCIPAERCCALCDRGKACGNSCIASWKNCHKGRGCACNIAEVCPD